MKQPLRLTALGLQHVLAMYAGVVIVPLIVGKSVGMTGEQLTYLVSIDIFMCGVATLLQALSGRFIGIGLPVMLGCTFTAVGPMISIGKEYGISSIYGSILVSGLIIVIISSIFGKLVRFFPPVVTGSVVTIIGITLIPVAINNMGGGEGSAAFGSAENMILSFGTLIFIIAVYRFSKGFLRAISILLGLGAGTVAAAMLGIIDFTPVTEASVVHAIKPLYFGMPSFEWGPILTMTLVAIVSLVESTGVYFALGNICDKKLSERDLAKGYRAEGLATILGGFLNAFPYTAFSQNVGLIQLSGVKTKKVIYIAGFMLLFLGLVPKVGAVTTIIPAPVLGGAMVAMFGMVIAQGIKMLSAVVFESQENSMIIACSVGMGLGVTVVPELFSKLPGALQILTSNGIVAGSFTAIALNILFHMIPNRQSKVQEAEVRAADPAAAVK